MQLHVSPRIPDGELPVSMNPGSSSPFGIVCFGDVELYLHSDEDCDRLIRAAARIKAMRAALGMPHVFAAASGYNCETCGMLAGWKDHLAPVLEDGADAAAVLAEAIRHGTPVIVTDDEPEPESDHPYGNAIRAARAWAGHVMPEEPAPPQDAPFATVPRLRRIGEAPDVPDVPAPLCGRCKNAPAVHFIESGAFCEPCVDRCHEALEFDHVCAVCATPAEASRM